MDALAIEQTEGKIPFTVLLNEAEDLIQKAREHEQDYPEDAEKVRTIYGTLTDALIEAVDPDREAVPEGEMEEISLEDQEEITYEEFMGRLKKLAKQTRAFQDEKPQAALSIYKELWGLAVGATCG